MSFPKASIKRFNEYSGCAPPVGAYDPKEAIKQSSATIDRSDRFKAHKEGVELPPTPSKNVFQMIQFAAHLNESIMLKPKLKKPECPSAEALRIKELEREIRILMQERTSQDKILSQREEDIKKLEGRLLNAQSDRSSLVAKVASMEKLVKDMNKSNDLMKNKVQLAENSSKKHETLHIELSALKHQTETKEKEINKLKQELDSSRKSQMSDLKMFEALTSSLESKIVDLENAEAEVTGKNKEVDREVKTEHSKKSSGASQSLSNGDVHLAQKVTEKLQKRFEQAIENYSSRVKKFHQIMEDRYQQAIKRQTELEMNLKQTEENLQRYSRDLQTDKERVNHMQKLLRSKIRTLDNEIWTKEDQIRYLKGEVSAVLDNASEKDQQMFEVEAEIAVLTESMEQLEEERNTLNINIKSLTEKYQIMEETMGHEKKMNKDIIENLEFQLGISKTSFQEIQQKYEQLEEKNHNVMKKMHTQMEEVERLSSELTESKDNSKSLEELLRKKEESITDLDVQLVGARIETEHLKEQANAYKEEVCDLKQQINDVQIQCKRQLKEEEEINYQTAREHADRIIDLEQKEICLLEENERYRSDISEVKSRCSELEGVVEKLEKDIVEIQRSSQEEIEKLNKAREISLLELQQELQNVKVEKENLEKDICQKDETINQYSEKISELEKSGSELKQKLESLNDEYENLKQSSESSLESVLQKQMDLKSKNEGIVKEWEQVNEEKKTLQGKIVELEEKLAEMQIAETNKEADLKKLWNSKKEIEEKVHEIQVQKNALDHAVQDLETKLQEAEGKLEKEGSLLLQTESKLKAEIDILTQSVEKNDSLLVDRDKKIVSLKVENSQLMKEIDYLTSIRNKDQSQTTVKLRDFEDRVKQLIEEKTRLFQQVKDSNALKEKFEAENVNLKTEMEKKKTEHKEMSKMANEKICNLNTIVDTLQGQVSSSEEEIHKCTVKVQELEEVNKKLEKDCESLTVKAQGVSAESESRLQALQIKLNSVVEENACLSDQMGKSEQIKSSLKNQVTELTEKIVSIEKNHETQTQKHMENIQQLQESLHISTHNNQKELSKLQCELNSVVKIKMEDNKIFTEKHNQVVSELQTERNIRKSLEEEFNILQARCKDLEAARVTYTKTIDKLEEENECLKKLKLDLCEHLTERDSDNQKLSAQVQHLQSVVEDLEQKCLSEREQHSGELEALREEIQNQQNAEEVEKARDQAERWKKQFEDLQSKVEPFMEQLDAFEFEKQNLLGRSNYAQAEMDRLASQYAKLLGHQNQKQKIHHVAKIKEENIHFKKEVTALREQINKQKRTIQKLEDKIAGNDGKRRFDPSKAFQHGKENQVSTASPLRDGNRK